MPKLYVKHLITSLRRFENVCNYKHIVVEEKRFIAATSLIPFQLTSKIISSDLGHT